MLDITDKEYIKLAHYIKDNYGINIKDDKKAMLTGRLYSILVAGNFNSFSEYYDALVADTSGELSSALVNKVTTNHTFFMREYEHFYFLMNRVLPELEGKISDRDLRVWCAACSSGEESYTLAMIIDSYFSKSKFKWDSKVLATDISQKVLDEAKAGVYNKDRIDPLPDIWKFNYFVRHDDNFYRVSDKIKSEVIYRRFNLMEKKFPFQKKFHVIFCRNVMIYFDSATRDELIKKFYDLLEVGGYLFIGHSETIDKSFTKFKYIMPAVYKKE